MFKRKRTVSFLLALALLISTLFLPSVSAVAEDSIDKLSEDILAVTVITLDSYDDVYTMLDRYEALGNSGLSSEASNRLEQLKARVDYLKENKLYYYDDFDNFQNDQTYGWWEAVNKDTILDDFDKVVTKQSLATANFVQYKDGTEGIVKNGSSGNCLAISALPSTAAKTLKSANNSSNIPAQIFALPDSVLNGKGIIKAGFKAYWSGSNRTYSLILSKQDNQHYTAIQLANGNGIKKATCNIDSNTFCTEEALVKSSDLNGYYYATWVDVTLEYITKDDGNYYRVTFLSQNISATEANVDKLTDVVEVKVDTPISNLYFTGSNVANSSANYQHIGIDDVAIYAISEVDYLKEQISALPDAENITIDNYNICMNLYQHYLRLSAEDKENISNIDKLLAAKQQAEKLWNSVPEDILSGKPIDFENKTDVSYISGNANVTDSNWGVTENTEKDSINSSDSVLHIIPNTTEDNLGVYLVSEPIASGNTPIKYFNFKMYLDRFTGNNNSRPLIVYDYQNEDNWRAISIWVASDGTITVCPYLKTSGSGVISNSTGKQNAIYAGKTELILNDTTSDFEMKEGGWIDVSLCYTGLDCELTVYTEDGFAKPGTYTYNLINGNSTRVGFAVSTDKFGMSVDDVSVVTNSLDSVITADSYASEHAYILSLRAATLSNVDYDALQAAVTEYAALEEKVKYALPFVGERLALLTERMNKIKDDPAFDLTALLRADDDYKDYTDNFDTEASLGRYQDVEMTFTYGTRNPSTLGRSPSVVYDSLTGSNVLQLQGSMLELKDCFLPEKGRMTTVTFDTWLDASSTTYPFQWTPLQFYISYIDADNWTAVRYYGSGTKVLGNIDVYTVKDGTAKGLYNQKSMNPAFDPWQPISVELSYIGDSGNCLIKIIQGDIKVEQTVNIGSVRGRFAMGSTSPDLKQMYDNVVVKMTKGDWDEDIVAETSTVYYSGNTYVSPGDVAIISGDSVGDFVTAVEIAQLPNDTAKGFGYINRTSFDFAGVESGTYSKEPVVPSWSGLSPVSAPILQKTEESVKFLIPDSFTEGIYAVKIFGKDNSIDADDQIIYINAPIIDYTVGNEGAIAQAGTELRIIGKNLAGNLTSFEDTAVKLNSIKVKLVDESGKVFDLSVSSADSDNSLKVQLPQELNGEYEVYVYNGYGDETAWSIPAVITVGAGPRSEWKDTVYNILDFGATGERYQNVTPIVNYALDYINENGGGTLYFPKGIYRFEYSVVLPEKITVAGEDTNSTIFLFTPYKWDYNELPEFLFGMTGNVAIEKLTIYGTRTGGVFRVNGESAENIYITDVRVYLRPYAGGTTQGNATVNKLVTATVAQNMINSEAVTPLLRKSGGYLSNLQMSKVDLVTYGSHRGIVSESTSQNEYWQLDNVHVMMGIMGAYQQAIINNSTIDNCVFEGAATGIWGHGVYYGNTTMQNVVVNNRELFVADHGPYINDGVLQQLDEYNFLIKGKYAASRLKGYQIYVSAGQGTGQTRIISKVENLEDGTTKLTVNSPFAIAPNRNSICILRAPRENIFFANCYFYNGSTCGFYGGVADVIYESCTFERVGALYQWAIGGDVNWYVSYNDNEIIYDPYFSHDDGGVSNNEFSKLSIIASGALPGYSRCFTIRGFNFNGLRLELATSAAKDTLRDVIVDNNTFYKSEYGINWDNTKGSTSIDGVFLYRNVFDDVDIPYSDSLLSASGTKNVYFSERAIIYGNTAYEQYLLLGDVNGDGEISIKDCTYIRYYSVNRIVLDDNQLSRADVNADGVVDLKDATMIRYFVVGKISEF